MARGQALQELPPAAPAAPAATGVRAGVAGTGPGRGRVRRLWAGQGWGPGTGLEWDLTTPQKGGPTDTQWGAVPTLAAPSGRIATKQARPAKGRRVPHPPRPCAGDWGSPGLHLGSCPGVGGPERRAAGCARNEDEDFPNLLAPRREVPRRVMRGRGRAASGVGR